MTDVTEHRPERLQAAVRSACNSEAMDHACDWPECRCKLFPAAIRAGVNAWEAFLVEQSGDGK